MKLYAEPPEPFVHPAKERASDAAEIARGLIARGGWSGAQLQYLERALSMNECGDEMLNSLDNMREARDREEALRIKR